VEVQQLNTDQQQLNTDQQQLNTDQQQLNTDQQQLNTDQQQLNTDQQQQLLAVVQQVNVLTFGKFVCHVKIQLQLPNTTQLQQLVVDKLRIVLVVIHMECV
jgi:multidrug efflux pump subunit AcrA (membrane-fusion protein)